MGELLTRFIEAGVLDPGDAAIGSRICVLAHEPDEQVHLAAALLIQALRAGSVALDLGFVASQVFGSQEAAVVTTDLPWPDPGAWADALATSPAVTQGPNRPGTLPLRWVGDLLYLERYWGMEELTRRELIARHTAPLASIDAEELRADLDDFFPGEGLAPNEPDLQRRAAAMAVLTTISVLAGGPGTGKTTTLARMLALLIREGERSGHLPRIALTAPTGKAATRMLESLRAEIERLNLPEDVAAALAGQEASTLHRLLGWKAPGGNRFQHDRTNPLPYDVVVVDEMSMVSLLLMTRLLEALRPSTRLILVGDPDQLASVEAGAVMADITRAHIPVRADLAAQLCNVDADGLALRGYSARLEDSTTAHLLGRPVVELTHNWRFGSGITALAAAVRAGDVDAALTALTDGGDEVTFVEADVRLAAPTRLVEDALRPAQAVAEAALAGDALAALALLERHRLLCGHRSGPYGAAHWSWQIERWLGEVMPMSAREIWYAGRPVLVTKNLDDLGLVNGDAGVVVPTSSGPQIAFPAKTGTRLISPTQISELDTLYAMTVHKAQGSQYDHVSLVLPPPGSPLLSRELVYTALTRAKQHVVVYGAREAVAEAVRRPALRASGLQRRLST